MFASARGRKIMAKSQKPKESQQKSSKGSDKILGEVVPAIVDED